MPMDPSFLDGIVPARQVLHHEPMAAHTSFQVGGPAQIYVDARSEEELLGALKALRERNIPTIVIGKGSNLLVSDRGIAGAALHCGLDKISVENGFLYAQAGVSLRQLYETALNNGLTGLEFASGIPGSLGGAIVMNAGAYGGELKDVIRSVRVVDMNGNVHELGNSEMDFGYRTSIVPKEGFTVLSAQLELPAGDIAASRVLAAKYAAARRSKQPLDKPSAGSTFKRPPDKFAGALIQSCGLKGATIGGAQVSRKHAGFVINASGASADDIYSLIRQIQHTVYIMTSVHLEPEIKFLGDF